MRPWKRICCATDFSAGARLAFSEAGLLASAFGSELILVHVHAPREPRKEAFFTPADLFEAVEPQLEQRVTQWARELADVERVETRVAILMGNPADEIVRFAREHDVDAIVLGAHGRTDLEEVPLGPVAEQVVRRAPGSVVVVRRRP